MTIRNYTKENAGPSSLKRMRLDCALTVTKALTEEGTFEGYGSVFDVLDLDNEIVVPGAFTKSLKERGEGGIKMLWQHRSDEPVGIWPKVEEDARGLLVQGQFALKAIRGRDAYELLKIKALDGLSIGFRRVKWEVDQDTGITRLTEIDLWEISPVTFPANTQARVFAVKHDDETLKALAELAQGVETARDFEEFLRDAGYSRSRAVAITGHGFNVNSQRDADLTELASQLKKLKRTINGGA